MTRYRHIKPEKLYEVVFCISLERNVGESDFMSAECLKSVNTCFQYVSKLKVVRASECWLQSKKKGAIPSITCVSSILHSSTVHELSSIQTGIQRQPTPLIINPRKKYLIRFTDYVKASHKGPQQTAKNFQGNVSGHFALS